MTSKFAVMRQMVKYDYKYLPRLLLFIPTLITSVKSERKMYVLEKHTPSIYIPPGNIVWTDVQTKDLGL
jgi:hypothetical protein